MTPTPVVHVAVVGAGFAGLTAAIELRRAGLSVVVLEALARVGGKTESQTDALGTLVDTGGQFVCDEMPLVRALADAAGVALIRNDHPGRPVTIPPEAADAWEIAETLFAEAGRYPTAPAGTSVLEWARTAAKPPVRVAGTATNNGGRAATGTVVAAFRSLAGVAIPPSAHAHVQFEPSLPHDVVAAAAGFVPGDVIKVMLRYDTAHWVAAGGNGTARFVQPCGLYLADASQPGAPMLVAFVAGPLAAKWRALDATRRRALVVRHAVAAFGVGAANPVAHLEREWPPDRWGAGGYCNVGLIDGRSARSLHAIETLRNGVGRLTFAASELAATFPGYVEGAIAAGRVAAQQVVDRLASG